MRSEGFKDVEVELMDLTVNPFKTFWDWYKVTWNDTSEAPFELDDPVVEKACDDVLNGRALATPMEAVKIQFKIRNLSRVALAQITRGRVGWAFNVESQMPRPVKHRVTIPLSIVRHDLYNNIKVLHEELMTVYDELCKSGVPPQDARYVLLHGQQTNLVVDTNYMALRGFFARRCENGLTDELNLVGRLLKLEIAKKIRFYPIGYGWQKLLAKLDCMGADKKVCLNNDMVFGNTGRYPSANDNVPSPDGKIKPMQDFKKSAWYMELKQLDASLLFPDEKEMIERWKSVD